MVSTPTQAGRILEEFQADHRTVNASRRARYVSKALAAVKAGGVKLGGPKLATARKHAAQALKIAADRHAANVLPVINEVRRAGATTLREIADALNTRGISTPRGGQWYAASVRNVLARA